MTSGHLSHDICKFLLNSEQKVRASGRAQRTRLRLPGPTRRRLWQPRFSTPIYAADPARVVRVFGEETAGEPLDVSSISAGVQRY